MAASASPNAEVLELLGDHAESLLGHQCKTIASSALHAPGPDFVDRVVSQTDRTIPVLRNLQSIFSHGRLGGTGTSRSCQSIRASSTPPAPRLRPTPSTSTPRT